MVLECPHCRSVLLLKHGDASPLDGERNHLCLNCRADLQPRRFRGQLTLSFFLCLPPPVPPVVAGGYLVYEGIYRFMLLPFLGAGACAYSAMLLRRAMREAVPQKKNTIGYPSSTVRLIDMKITPDGVVSDDPVWVDAFTAYANGVIAAAGRCLAGGGRYKVAVVTECDRRGREHKLGFRGKPDEDRLNEFFEEIKKPPV